jgi:hypothetical protein
MIETALDLIPPIITLILGYLVGYAVYHHVKQAYAELVDLLVAIRDAWDDNAITDEEFNKIINEAREFIAAAKKRDGL